MEQERITKTLETSPILDTVLQNKEMFQLPNQPVLLEKFIDIVERLRRQYVIIFQSIRQESINTNSKDIAGNDVCPDCQTLLDVLPDSNEGVDENNMLPGCQTLLDVLPDSNEGVDENNMLPDMQALLADIDDADEQSEDSLLEEFIDTENDDLLETNICDVVYSLLENVHKESVAEIIPYLSDIPENERVKIISLLLEKAPKESATGIIFNLHLVVPEAERMKIAHLLIEKASHESARSLAFNLDCFSVENRVEIFYLLIEKVLTESASSLIFNLQDIPEDDRVKIVYLLLKKAPLKSVRILIPQIEKYISKNEKKQLIEETINVLKILERDRLEEFEYKNPDLYKGIESPNFQRKDFIKTGSETILLGNMLMGKVIIRIIPEESFYAWMTAYTAVDVWKAAGFTAHIPIEPIYRYKKRTNGDIQVATGVLGITVDEYLAMYSTQKHHENVENQVESIKMVFQDIGIIHGHTHNKNFCILHQRDENSTICWDLPPFVYCIDFDHAKCKNTHNK